MENREPKREIERPNSARKAWRKGIFGRLKSRRAERSGHPEETDREEEIRFPSQPGAWF